MDSHMVPMSRGALAQVAFILVMTALLLPATACKGGLRKVGSATEPVAPITPAPMDLGMPGPKLDLDAADKAPVFADDSILGIHLEAPWEALIEPRNEAVIGVGRMGAWWQGKWVEMDVHIQLRGRIRLRLCDFPNFTVRPKDPSLPTEGTPFEGLDAIKFTAHCDKPAKYDDGVERRVIGHEKIVNRERFGYTIWSILSDRGLGTRRAQITYTDSRNKDRFTKSGFLLEDKRDLAKRYGGTIVKDSSKHYRPSKRAQLLDAKDAALVHLFLIMLGTEDWTLWELNESVAWRIWEFDRRGNRYIPEEDDYSPDNMFVVERDKGQKLIPEPYDYDLCNAVTGYIEHQQGTRIDAEHMPGEDDQFRDIVYSLQAKFRARHEREAVDYALGVVRAQRPTILKALEAAQMDEEGVAIMSKRLDDFYRASSDEYFWRETVTVDNIPLYKDQELTDTFCEWIPPGMIMEILERGEIATKVRVLDFWEDSCYFEKSKDPYEGWLPAELVSKDFPRARK